MLTGIPCLCTPISPRRVTFALLILLLCRTSMERAIATALPSCHTLRMRPEESLTRLPSMRQVPPRASKKILNNGLTIIVLENHNAPVVSVRVYVKTGSIYDGRFAGSGISHLIEHTLGEGTKTRTKAQINALVAEVGGQANAYTSKDTTCYHITTASRYFEKAVDILSDQVMNATFPEQEVEIQKGVIRNEMAMNEDDPDRVLFHLFDATAWREHPNRFPIIGYRQIFDQLTRQDILDYYASRYVPDNTIVAVAGDIETGYSMQVLEKYFGDWRRRAVPQVTLPQEPAQQGTRRAVKEMPIQMALMLMGFHTIPISHPDLYPLDVLAMILGHGESSRLVARVQKQARLVTSVTAWSATPHYDAGYFGIKATLDPVKLADAEQAILLEIERLKSTLVTSAELAKAKRQNEASFIYSNESVENQAALLASDEIATGDITFSQTYIANINRVTKQDIQRVVRKYFRPDNYTIAIVQPRSRAGEAEQTIKGRKVGQIHKVILPNGMTLLLKENHAHPTVNFIATFYGGTRYETEANNGISRLTASLLTLGTKTASGERIATIMDGIGGSIYGFSGNNSLGVQATVLKQDFDTGLNIFADVIMHPVFPQQELDRLKAESLATLKRQEDDPFSLALRGVKNKLFGTHPYRFNPVGSQESLKVICRNDIVDFHAKVVRPEGALLAVFGDFDVEVAKAKIAAAFRHFQGKPVSINVAPPVFPSHQIEETQVKEGIQQTVIAIGFPGLTIKDPDRYALDVLDAVLSGVDLPGGRLHERLRDNQLVYVVHAYSQLGLEPGAFIIYAATHAQNKETVIGILKEEITRITSVPVSAEELWRAKVMCITAHELGQESNAEQARQAAYDELYGLGYDDSRKYAERIESVTPEDVLRVGRRVLRMDQSARVVIQRDKEG